MLVTNNFSLADMYLSWKTGIQYEIDYWDRWLETQGGIHGVDYNMRLVSLRPIDIMLEKIVSRFQHRRICILDVGSGAISCLGSSYGEYKLDIVPVDPLAHQYVKLLRKHHITDTIKPAFALAEDLAIAYDRDAFEVVHCQNALDHSIDPSRALIQMLHVCKIGGYVLLRHNYNEAINENWQGFHQWNLDLKDDDFILWNQSCSTNLTDELKGFTEHEVVLRDGYIINCFRKLSDVPQGLLGNPSSRFFSFQSAILSSLGHVD